MKLLLDTHTFLWLIGGSLNLSNMARDLIEDPENQRFLSIASLWEISIKVSIGKLELDMTLAKLVKQEIYGNAIELLEIRPEHLDELSKLSFHHKDPFDRLIISQSLVENIPVVTRDSIFESYPMQVLWWVGLRTNKWLQRTDKRLRWGRKRYLSSLNLFVRLPSASDAFGVARTKQLNCLPPTPLGSSLVANRPQFWRSPSSALILPKIKSGSTIFRRCKMPTLNLTNEQVVELVKQLPTEQQVEVFRFLLLQQWGQWESLSRYGVDRARLVAQERRYDWDTMTEEEREAFVDEVVHEN